MSPTRRDFITYGLAASTSALLGGRAFAAAAPERVLRLGISIGRGSQTDKMSEAFAQEVFAKTGGRIRVDVYFAGALGGEKEIAEDIAAGVVDFGLVTSAGYAGPIGLLKLAVFDVPFLFRDLAHARSVLDGPIGKTALGSLHAVGLEGLAWGENGFRQITTSDKPVRAPSDLVGLRIRIPQSETMLAAFRSFGADPVALPFPDVFVALADGSISGQENAINSVRAAELYRVQKYLCMTDHVYSALILLGSSHSLEALSPPDRAIIRQAAQNSTNVARQINDSTGASDIAELKQRGMTVVTDVDRAAFVKANASAQMTYETMFGEDALLSIQTFRG